MDISELSDFLKGIPDKILSDAADIVAHTATKGIINNFRTKSFDSNPWKSAKNPERNNSLLIDRGHLWNSVKPIVITNERVVVSAGNSEKDTIKYARAHNEGFQGNIKIPAHRRGKNKSTLVKSHTRHMNIPQRQYMGNSKEINKRIHYDIETHIKEFFGK